MTRFLDGPAKGKVLMLKRAARFLRVVHDGKEFDALDQPTDTPRPEERIYAYEIAEPPGWAFIDGSKCRGRYPIASYKAVPIPLDEAIMRDAEKWHEWCVARAAQHPRPELI